MAGKNNLAKTPGGRTMINISREDAVLVHCARLELSPERYQMLKDILSGQLDWDLLVQKANWHRLLLQVAYHLRSQDLSKNVPNPILKRMKSLQYTSLARNMVFLDELSHLLTIFQKEGIPVIILKGAALLGNIYSDISLRPMSDLDILVRPEHLDHAETLALRRGYSYFVTQEQQERAKHEDRHLENLILREKGTMLEIHRFIVNPNDPYHFELDGFWERAKPFTSLGANALTLATEDLLIHLSINFLLDRRYHSAKALGQLCDISEVVKYYGNSLNWDLIEKTSRENGILKGLHFVLYTCQHLLETPVPASILNRFQPREFNPASAELFIRRRILDTRPWLAHGLLDSRRSFSRRRMILAIINRFFSFTKDIIRKNGNGDDVGSSNSRRLKDILPRLVGVLLKPANLADDLKLDRWLHDLYSTN
jgi:hypothetical protein